MAGKRPLGIAMVGHSFMGSAHTRAWRTAPLAFGLDVEPSLRVLVGRDPGHAAAAADRLGWEEWTVDPDEVLRRDDIDIVDICSPSDTHARFAIAALEAGKHVLCEKPLANSIGEAAAMADAARLARAAGVRSMVGFTYRRVPALALARQWIAEGRLGTVRHVRAAYLQDWLADAAAPLVWRLERDRAGSGALGDIGSHIVDLSQFLLDDRLVAVSAALDTYVPQRSREDGSLGTVTVDDAAAFAGRFASGARATFEASRVALGRKNDLRLEVFGSRGSLAFDLEHLNELWYYDASLGENAGFTRVLVTEPAQPYLNAWWPPGHVLGWDHAFVNQAADFLSAVLTGNDPEPGFDEGLAVQRVLDAVERSADDDSRWASVSQASAVMGASR